jgi:membrane-associated phospholipid phosphatase
MTSRFVSGRGSEASPLAAALLLLLGLLPPLACAASGPAGTDPPSVTTASQPAIQSSTPMPAAPRIRLRSGAWTRQRWLLPTASVVAFLAAMRIHEGSSHGPFGIDYSLKRGDTGIFARSNQLGLEYGTVAFEAAGALYLGNDTELGHTFWQAADSTVFAGAAAQVLKYAFRRARPVQDQGPNAWFQGGDQSFPSGEVTLQASFVTPFILHYQHQYPWIWAAELLPIYDGYARMKSQGHWQSDVLAGWALGTAFGYWATQRKVPLLVEVLPHGVSVGFYKRF